MKTKKLRILTALLAGLLIVVSMLGHFGVGNFSALGFQEISVLCPLGAIAAMIASKTIIPAGVVSILLSALLFIVFARAFCGWICPVPVVAKARNIFKKNNAKSKECSASVCAETKCSGCQSTALVNATTKKRGQKIDSRHIVLAGALLTTLLFGFPVFCIVCPIGLTFASVILIFNLFAFGDVTWTILFAPALLCIELLFYKKWCHNLCPLGAMMSLVAKSNKTFVPTIDNTKCLESTKDVHCGQCTSHCPEGINPRLPELSSVAWSECIKCRSCVDACPTKAITMPLIKKK